MLSGRLEPELGGRPEILDIVGVNYYADNQWILGGQTVFFGHPLYRPFHKILEEVHARYRRPVFVAETGTEGETRPGWLGMIASEVRAAMAVGVPVEGICLYPVLCYPGWTNERHCDCGLLSLPDEAGRRSIHRGMAAELGHQQSLFAKRRRPARRRFRVAPVRDAGLAAGRPQEGRALRNPAEIPAALHSSETI